MALPSNITFGTVIGQFLTSTGAAASGTVSFFPSVNRILDTTSTPPTTIISTPSVVTLDGTGAFSVSLAGTDNAILTPTGWTWTAVFNLVDTKGVRIPVGATPLFVPSNTTTDITTVTKIASANGVVITKGDKGDPNSLSIGTVTSSLNPSATITGSAPNQVLNLVLPSQSTSELEFQIALSVAL